MFPRKCTIDFTVHFVKTLNRNISAILKHRKLILFLLECSEFYLSDNVLFSTGKNILIFGFFHQNAKLASFWAGPAGMWAVIKNRPVHKTLNANISAILCDRKLILFLLESSQFCLSDNAFVVYVCFNFLNDFFRLEITMLPNLQLISQLRTLKRNQTHINFFDNLLLNAVQNKRRVAFQTFSWIGGNTYSSLLEGLKDTQILNDFMNHHYLKHNLNTSREMGNSFLIKFEGKQCSLYLKNLLLLSGDVELNPGPSDTTEQKDKYMISTYNCRGLGDSKKLKIILNRFYQMNKFYQTAVHLLQETKVVDERGLKYGWRGQYVFTPGTGRAQGCITLISESSQVEEILHFKNRGHLIRIHNFMENKNLLIANLYCPCGYRNEKLDFFDLVKRSIEQNKLPNDDIVIGGDLNIVFNKHEMLNRHYTPDEKQMGQNILDLLYDLEMQDCWENENNCFTWQRGRIMSRLDRIFYNIDGIAKLSCTTEWTLGISDHATVKVEFEKLKSKTIHRRANLNTELIKNIHTARTLKERVRRKLNLIPEHWDPHMILEFCKMIIRSEALHLQGEQKVKEKNDLQKINEEINRNMDTLDKIDYPEEIQEYIYVKLNKLFADREKAIEKTGNMLSQRSNTRWYQEGEKSNKYFLGLLKRKSKQSEITLKKENGTKITDDLENEELIRSFYSNLYNKIHENDLDESVLNNMEKLNETEIHQINRPLTIDELKRTVDGMKDSAPGPDGIPYSYIKFFWEELGQRLLNSWNYGIQIGKLTQSHTESLLKLLPKPGKDLSEIKNWRPITLSNCDIKIITKTLAAKITKEAARIISGTQTAYIKGRQITDNIRMLKAALDANKLEQMNGIIMALDAQKAFDSLRHDFIKAVFKKIGLDNFIPVFELLYKDNKTKILINGKICDGYAINNGVKQGDALSCIIFILCMEPILRNIEKNRMIRPIQTEKIDFTWPKVFGYADDINLVIKNDIISIREVFKEYEKFSRSSGLFLNADKTEIMKISCEGKETYQTKYCEQEITLESKNEINVNGIIFNNDVKKMIALNYENVLEKLQVQFQSWSNRNLSTLGKILIYKTFGLSQILYKASCVGFSESQHKSMRDTIYKFIWNKDFKKNKAPDRVKREILCTEMKKGGYGMVDHEEVCKSIAAKQAYRFNAKLVNHPITELLQKSYKITYVHIESLFNCLPSLYNGAKTMQRIIENYMMKSPIEILENDAILINNLLQEKCKNMVDAKYLKSIEYHWLKNKHNLNLKELFEDEYYKNIFLRISNTKFKDLLKRVRNTFEELDTERLQLIPGENGKYYSNSKITSKWIRNQLKSQTLIVKTKLIEGSEEDMKYLYNNLIKLTSIKHKEILLRFLHGDIFSRDRLMKFGLIDNFECERCHERETIRHMFFECKLVRKIWKKFSKISDITINSIEDIFDGGKNDLKICAEILKRLHNIKRPKLPVKAFLKGVLIYLHQVDYKNRKYFEKLIAKLDAG